MSLCVGIVCCMWHVMSFLVLFMLCCVVCGACASLSLLCIILFCFGVCAYA